MNNISLGKLGEVIAGSYLKSQGYEIMESNYRCQNGEIDLITVDYSNPSEPQLVFVEVKARTSEKFGQPQDSVTHQKQQKMVKTALHFINRATGKLPHIWRFDVIAIKLNGKGELNDLNHIKHILNG